MTRVDVVAFDPGGTTGWAVLQCDSSALDGRARNTQSALWELLLHKDYGEIDCGTKQNETGVGVKRGHGAQNILGEDIGVDQILDIVLRKFPASAIVTEDFILDMGRADMSRDILLPVRIMARMDYGLHRDWALHHRSGRHPLHRFFVQNRALAKTTCSDTRLRNWKLYDPKSGPHARDAMRHAYYFLRSCRGNDPASALRRHLAWPHLFADPAKLTNSDIPKAGRKPAKKGTVIPHLR